MNHGQLIPIDLHCHSMNSDGSLPVKELLNIAKSNGSKYLALTDHDTVDGVTEAKTYAKEIGLTLFGGVEISVTWENALVHILGLNINESNTNLLTNLAQLGNLRIERGHKIADKLAKIGIKNALEGAMQYCSGEKSLSRTHFNRFLVDHGYAKPGKAFEKYLAPGKAAYVPQQWANLESALEWIIQSGGIGVIAHPSRYKFTRTKLIRLIEQFKYFGGRGIEVISSAHSLSDVANIAKFAHDYDLLGSVGSDFHAIDTGYRKIKVGVNSPLPAICEPIFNSLGINPAVISESIPNHLVPQHMAENYSIEENAI
ncbi:MAG: PHP domain-containing protein [Burkholderiales bacterium]|nr:PHP domain-containing protein [Burkholderiales bacterium]